LVFEKKIKIIDVISIYFDFITPETDRFGEEHLLNIIADEVKKKKMTKHRFEPVQTCSNLLKPYIQNFGLSFNIFTFLLFFDLIISYIWTGLLHSLV